MARHVVMERPGDPEGAVLVRDGFSFVALVVPVLWLLWHRMWFAALGAFALVALATISGWPIGLPGLIVAAELAVAAWVALEGGAMRVSALEAQGYRQAGVIHAATAMEAEIRWAAAERPAPALAPAASPVAVGFAASGAGAFPVFSPARG
jgi:hypothetical protein